MYQHPAFSQRAWPDDDWLDPETFSKSNLNLTLSEVRDAIATLLLLSLPKKESSHCINQLNKVVGSSVTDDSNTTTATTLIENTMESSILRSPLWIIRDAATYHSNQNTQLQQSFVSSFFSITESIISCQSSTSADSSYFQCIYQQHWQIYLEVATATSVEKTENKDEKPKARKSVNNCHDCNGSFLMLGKCSKNTNCITKERSVSTKTD
jgi:hypothetical protein